MAPSLVAPRPRSTAWLLLARLVVGAAEGSGLRDIGGRTTWNPLKTSCPCNSTELCQPVRGAASERKEQVYVMHAGFVSPRPGAPDDAYIWRAYDWEQITTVAVFGTLSAELYCHAHAHGARVTFGYSHTPWEVNYTRVWQNATLVSEYAHAYAAYTLSTRTDGWSLDMEAPVWDPKDAAQLTALVRAISDAVHRALPSAQVTFASGILGFESTVDQFDLVGISKAVDRMLVMCYEAAKNTSAPGFQKANMVSSSGHAAVPWIVFPCGSTVRNKPPLQPLPLLKQGVAQYAEQGIPASKLILAFPWFGYSWKCSVDAATGKEQCDAAHLLCHCEVPLPQTISVNREPDKTTSESVQWPLTRDHLRNMEQRIPLTIL
jgi:Di-N-acetylchitobiase